MPISAEQVAELDRRWHEAYDENGRLRLLARDPASSRLVKARLRRL